MKTKKILCYFLFSSCALLAACNTPLNPGWWGPNGYSYMQRSELTNASIMGNLIVINQNEIALAKQARAKSSNPLVRQYAAMLIADHSTNLVKTKALSRKIGITPEMGPMAINIDTQGKQELAQLQGLTNGSFDRAYIADMIQDHRNALAFLDHSIQVSTSPMLTNHLMATRQHVALHLEKALMIQKQLP